MSAQSDKAEQELKRLSVSLNIPEDVLRAICRLESKRIWRESLEEQIDDADLRIDEQKEKGRDQ